MADRALLDTNVLVYAAFPNAPQHAAALRLCNDALARRVDACVSPQVLLEFFATVTNPKRVTSPRDHAAAWAEVEKYRAALPVLSPPADLVVRVRSLAEPIGVTRQRVFDVQHAATMLANGIRHIYTFDDAIFKQIPGITVIAPL